MQFGTSLPKNIFEDNSSVLRDSEPSYTMVKNGFVYFNMDEKAAKMTPAGDVQ